MANMIEPLFPEYTSKAVVVPDMPRVIFTDMSEDWIRIILKFMSKGKIRVIDKDGNELKVRIYDERSDF